mmetsp:Transcript_18403/g.25944  ORF Transcript_18403/g.25944 Transcript_18403/m.25944 type:complete len:371 (+) Transcript_18403:248-1360(+)
MDHFQPQRKSKKNRVVKKWLLPAAVFMLSTNFLLRENRRWNPDPEYFRMPFSSRRLQSYNMTEGYTLPAWTDNMANVWDPIKPGDQPFFWYIPKSGGTTMEKLFGWCLNLTQATDEGTPDAELNGLQVYEHTYEDIEGPFTPKFVNVHTNTLEWIAKLKVLNFATSGIADLIMSQHLVTAIGNLFDSDPTTPKARGVLMFRHPVKRTVDQFYYRQHATWEETFDEELATMSLLQYAQSDKWVENYYTRSLLSLKYNETISKYHVDVAKEIMRRKFLVNVFEWYDVSMVRIEKYFGWWDTMDVLNNVTINNCHYKIIDKGDHAGTGPKVPDDETIYHTILIRNWADMELYFYAKNLFPDQRLLLGTNSFGA